MADILVVEDDSATASEIIAALFDHGLSADHVTTGREAILQAAAGSYEAVILDRMLPGGIDGLGVLTALRSAGVDVPVLILSALSAVDERVRGLRSGGDDYLAKPFEFMELTARLDALMRRRSFPAAAETVLKVGDLQFDFLTRTVRRNGRLLDVLPREYMLLEYMARNADRVVTRTMIFEEVWGYRYDERTNVIDVHIAKLRRKLEGPEGLPSLIYTVRGAGYILRAPD